MPPFEEDCLKRKTRKTLKFTAEHAAHALHILISDGKVAAKDVAHALKRREAMVRELRSKLAALEHGVASGIADARKIVTRRAGRKPKRRVSAARRAAMKLHGKYLGTVRPLSKANRAKVKAIREKSGVHAAIRAARRMATPAAPRAKVRRNRVRGARPNYQRSQQRKLARYQQRELPKPDKHGGSGAGRQQGGSGAGRERG
jgi:hypothetical protein